MFMKAALIPCRVGEKRLAVQIPFSCRNPFRAVSHIQCCILTGQWREARSRLQGRWLPGEDASQGAAPEAMGTAAVLNALKDFKTTLFFLVFFSHLWGTVNGSWRLVYARQAFYHRAISPAQKPIFLKAVGMYLSISERRSF